MNNQSFLVTKARFELLILYVLFVSYIISSLVNVDSNAINYAVHLLFLPFIVFYLLSYQYIYFYENNIIHYFLFLIVVIFLMLPSIQAIYIKIFLLKVICLTFFIREVRVDTQGFTKVINITYLIYLGLSILVWLKFMPGYNYAGVNSFIIHIGFMNFETLYGMSGSTADIDSYSGLIFIWNVFLNSDKNKKYIIIISFIALLMTLRSTPIVATILSLSVYICIRNKPLAFLSLLGVVVSLFGVIYMLTYFSENNVYFLSSGLTWNDLFWVATHARSSLWMQQMDIYLNSYNTYDYIMGPNLNNLAVNFITPDGVMRHETFNPHNSYLITIYRSLAISLILYMSFLYYSVKSFDRMTFPIIFYIALAGLTNSTVFGLENPIYVLIIIYIVVGFSKSQNNIHL